MRLFSVFVVTILLLLVSNAAYGQPAQLGIDDNGQVVAQHQHHHARNGDKITWVRTSGSGKPWAVVFSASPCAEGGSFGPGRTCTVKVACNKAGDAACKAYPYQSSLGGRAALYDPDIIIDP